MLQSRGRVIALGSAVLIAALGALIGPAPLFSQSPADDRRQSQQNAPPPVFRGGAAFVRVDVYPRRNGRIVEGLTAADFEVAEDGRPQTVETFQFIRFETALIDDERRDPTSVADSERQAADPRNRLFVVYLDPYHLSFEGSLNVAPAVMAFLTRTIGPADLFATMTPKRPVSQLTFSRRLEVLEEDLQDFWRDVQVGIDEVEFRLETCPEITSLSFADQERMRRELLGRHRQDMLMTSLENLTRRLGGLKDERKNILLMSQGWNPMAPLPELTAKSRPTLPEVAVSPRGRLGIGPQQPNDRDVNWCAQNVGRLAHTDFDDRFVRLIDMAREANVTFYPVDVGGLRVGGSPVLRTLAENTDGTAIFNTNDITGAVRRLTDSISAYYLLGYYSTNPATDGRFRRITVTARQPGIDVAARRGYIAATPEIAAAAASRTPPSAGLTAVDAALGALARADAELHASVVHGGDRLEVVAELASRLVSEPGWRGGADILATARSSTGAVIESSGRIDAGLRSVRLQLPLAPGNRDRWTVALRATGNPGRLELSASAQPADGPLFGDPLTFRAGSSARAAVRPAADRQYRRSERVRVEWPVLSAVAERSARLLDRRGQPLSISPVLSIRDEGSQPIVTVELSLAPLAQGDYIIELTGTGDTGTDRKLLAFRVLQ